MNDQRMTQNNKRYKDLSKALRDNLLRRKAQVKGRKEDTQQPTEKVDGVDSEALTTPSCEIETID